LRPFDFGIDAARNQLLIVPGVGAGSVSVNAAGVSIDISMPPMPE
jgi:hypothetical protein